MSNRRQQRAHTQQPITPHVNPQPSLLANACRQLTMFTTATFAGGTAGYFGAKNFFQGNLTFSVVHYVSLIGWYQTFKDEPTGSAGYITGALFGSLFGFIANNSTMNSDGNKIKPGSF
ncbi:MAG: hypothetical protein KIT27_10105 [Legionellales bacterium]|nr:hypothetical protein [Legionellales bacterium]